MSLGKETLARDIIETCDIIETRDNIETRDTMETRDTISPCPGSPCLHSAQCVPGSLCSPLGQVCVCEVGQVQAGDTCSPHQDYYMEEGDYYR